MKVNSSKAGFSLVEVLVVVLIASIVLVVLATVLGSSFEILRTGETRSQLNSNARVALEYIADDISSAAYIPLAFDRDLNGVPDEAPQPPNGLGYGLDAVWRTATDDNPDNVPVLYASFFLSEAWSDRIQTVHDSSISVDGQLVRNRQFTVPKVLTVGGQSKVAEYRSFFRLAVPANADMPYYLAGEWDRNGDGTVDLRNTGSSAGIIPGYPEIVPVGPHKESGVVIQDLFASFRDGSSRRYRQIPISSNITRVKYEYLHEVPVYMSRDDGTDGIEIAYQIVEDGTEGNEGEVVWLESSQDRYEGCEPIVSHWELRVVDVGHNAVYTDSAGSSVLGGGSTGAFYSGMEWRLADQYPETPGNQITDAKLDGTHVTPNTGQGLASWNCSAFFTNDVSDPVNAPIDRLAYVTTGISAGSVVEGGIAELRPDMEAFQGSSYYQDSIDPYGFGDYGDADGIPDGDGIPDDPVPGWWLPYVRAVRVTVVATPRRIIEERLTASGQRGSSGTPVFYRLDSPVPYSDANRTTPLYNQKNDWIGTGQDLVLTKTVPVDFVYSIEPIIDPASEELEDRRRVTQNYRRGLLRLFHDQVQPDSQIQPLDPFERFYELDVN